MSINPGKLDRVISIMRREKTRDSMGGEVITLADYMPQVWAESVDIKGREFRAAGSLRSETTHAFRIRYIAELNYDTGNYAITYENRTLDIVSVAEEGRYLTQLIQCKYTGGAPA